MHNLFNIPYAMHTVRCTVYDVHCTLYIIHSTMYNVYIVKCIMRMCIYIPHTTSS